MLEAAWLRWSKRERRWVSRMGALCAALSLLTTIAATCLALVDVFLAMVVLGAGLTVASLLLAATLLYVELSRPEPRARPVGGSKLLARHDEARAALRSAEQRASFLVRASDPRSREELDVLRRLVARVYAQQALVHASMGDRERFRSAVSELREELLASARTVMIAGPVRRPPLER